MKKYAFLPGFEFAFAISIMVILALPHIVTAQDHKEFKVNINNTDTTVNGKNIKDLSAGERVEALKELKALSRDMNISITGDDKRMITIRRRMNGDSAMTLEMQNNRGENWRPMARLEFKRRDSTGRGVEIMRDERGRGPETRPFRVETFVDDNKGAHDPIIINGRFNRKNTENFSFSNVDKDGISTHVNYRISDADAESAKRITGIEKTDLDIQDITLTPMFSTGKTVLNLTLAAKSSADITFKDSDGTALWTGKITNGDFSKTFELPKNGVYYLQVKQAGKLALRRIVKEE